MSYSYAIFDLDGTLLNTLDDLANSTNHVLEQFGFPTHQKDKYNYFVGNGMKKLIERVLPAEVLDTPVFDEVLSCFMEYYEQHSLDLTRPYEGIENLIENLISSGVKVGMVTNKPHDKAIKIMDRFFGDKFDFVQGQCDLFPTKPDPASTLFVLEKLEGTPENTVFVGDSGVDMQTAKNAGLTAVGVLWGFRTADELSQNGADFLAQTALELERFILE